MSSQNFDPVEVAALQPEVLDSAVQQGLSAFQTANDLDELKTARRAHDGDRSALALANREIGALPPAARKAAGQRVGEARRGGGAGPPRGVPAPARSRGPRAT